MNKKINTISLLRIIATFMVVMVHFGQSIPMPVIIHKIVMFGANGVIIFYLISGYVIAASLSRDFDILRFYYKRIVRIVPIYYFVITVNLIASIILQFYPKDITKLSWWRYYLFIHAIIPTNDYFYWNNLAALWTMSAFALFYLVAPTVHYFTNCSEKKHVRLLIIIILGMILSVISTRVYLMCSGVFTESGKYLSSHSPFVVLFVFFMGMYIYYCCKEENSYLFLIVIGIIGLIFKYDLFCTSSLLGILVAYSVKQKVKCGERMARLLSLLDEYSFSIYLGHTTVMFIISRIQEIVGFSIVKLAIFDLVGCIVFIPILHKCVEKTANKYLQRLF